MDQPRNDERGVTTVYWRADPDTIGMVEKIAKLSLEGQSCVQCLASPAPEMKHVAPG